MDSAPTYLAAIFLPVEYFKSGDLGKVPQQQIVRLRFECKWMILEEIQAVPDRESSQAGITVAI